MKQYVLIYVEFDNKILVIEKKKPIKQAGRFNLLGGKIEPNEHHTDAAVRELEEESGLNPVGIEFYGKLTGQDFEIFCHKITVKDNFIKQGDTETEKVFWLSWDELSSNKKLIPNLKVIIPLFMTNTKNWNIQENNNWEETTKIIIEI